MPTPRSKTGRLHHEDGSVAPARFYYGDHEEDPPHRTQIDPTRYTTWVEDDGTVGIRRGTSISVGGSAAYSANYDALDWGN
jgi:hypothetical protein